LSCRSAPTAGATGAKVTEEVWQPSDTSTRGSCEVEDTYSVKFLQQVHDLPSPSSLQEIQDNNINTPKPSAGFALKKGGAKRVVFTEEQKSIMIEYYNRQKSSQIRANPSDVIASMRAAGIPELKESQIKICWSTYHRKQKQLVEDMREQALEMEDSNQVYDKSN